MLTIKPQQDRSPIIVDDSYDLEEAVALTFGGDYNEGLLAKADLGAALLSMSNLNGTFSRGSMMPFIMLLWWLPVRSDGTHTMGVGD